MLYELINPSDPYVFEAEDFETATLTVFALSTAFGAKPKEGEEVPVFIFGGSREWYIGRFGRTPDDGMAAKKTAVADALGSFMYGHFEDVRRYNAALSAITDPEKKLKFIDEWQDGCSSVNNIGGVAHELGRLLSEENKV